MIIVRFYGMTCIIAGHFGGKQQYLVTGIAGEPALVEALGAWLLALSLLYVLEVREYRYSQTGSSNVYSPSNIRTIFFKIST